MFFHVLTTAFPPPGWASPVPSRFSRSHMCQPLTVLVALYWTTSVDPCPSCTGGGTELHAVLHKQSSKCQVMGNNPFPPSTGCTPVDTAHHCQVQGVRGGYRLLRLGVRSCPCPLVLGQSWEHSAWPGRHSLWGKQGCTTQAASDFHVQPKVCLGGDQ